MRRKGGANGWRVTRRERRGGMSNILFKRKGAGLLLLAVAAAFALAGCGRLQQARRVRLYAEERNAVQAGDYDGAIDICGKLLAMDPHDTTALCDRARAWRFKNEFDKCVADATAALSENPGLVMAYGIRGSALIGRDNAKAQADLDKAIQLAPEDRNTYVHRSYFYLVTRDYDKSVADASEAIRIDPGLGTAYINRGAALAAQGKLDDAMKDLDKAITLSSTMGKITEADAYAERASAFNLKGEYDKAFADAESAIALNPHNHQALYERASAHGGRKEYDDAIADFNALIAAVPDEGAAYLGLARAYAETHENQKALATLDRAISLIKGNGRAYRARASVRRELKDYAGAAADYSQALQWAPEDASCLNGFAWFLATCPDASQRDGKRAFKMATKACELSQWQTPNDVDTLAAAYAESGDFANAVKFEQWYLALPGVTDEAAKKARERLADYQNQHAYREE